MADQNHAECMKGVDEILAYKPEKFSVERFVGMSAIDTVEVCRGQNRGSIRTKGRFTCTAMGVVVLMDDRSVAHLTHHPDMQFHSFRQQLGDRLVSDLKGSHRIRAINGFIVTDKRDPPSTEPEQLENWMRELVAHYEVRFQFHRLTFRSLLGVKEVGVKLAPPGSPMQTEIYAEGQGSFAKLPSIK